MGLLAASASIELRWLLLSNILKLVAVLAWSLLPLLLTIVVVLVALDILASCNFDWMLPVPAPAPATFEGACLLWYLPVEFY